MSEELPPRRRKLNERDREMIRLGMALSTLVMQNRGEGVPEFWDALSDEDRIDCVAGLISIQGGLLVQLEKYMGIPAVEIMRRVAINSEIDDADDQC